MYECARRYSTHESLSRDTCETKPESWSPGVQEPVVVGVKNYIPVLIPVWTLYNVDRIHDFIFLLLVTVEEKTIAAVD